jgi:hypothetical protein
MPISEGFFCVYILDVDTVLWGVALAKNGKVLYHLAKLQSYAV